MLLRRTLLCLSRKKLVADSSLVSLPAGVTGCSIYRNVVSLEEEARIYEELSRILAKDGESVVAEGSDTTERTVKNTYLEIYGEQEYTEVKNWVRKEIRKVPGFVWFPTLTAVMRDLAPPFIGAMPDTGRVVEHNLPGYEMHVEHPTVGSSFVYLNLLSDTVLQFDDESTGRIGTVLVPSRALLHVFGEARWGFRFGELSESTHFFRNAQGLRRSVEPDLRLSVQLWKLNPRLLDSRTLQDRLQETTEHMSRRKEESASRDADKRRDEEEAVAAALGATDAAAPFTERETVSPATSFMAGAFGGASSAEGVLGGDYDESGKDKVSASLKEKKKPMEELKTDYMQYRNQFHRIKEIMDSMKESEAAGQPINDLWIQKQMKESAGADTELDRYNGFDSTNIEGTWETASAKARFYKSKLKTMDYDGTAFANPTMPNFETEGGPMDIHETVEKLSPYVKDGEKILHSLSPKK